MTRPAMERRRAPRAKAEFAIQLGDVKPTGARERSTDQLQPAQLKDLSTGGLCCLLGEALREMTLVELSMQLPGDATPHRVQGAVVRCAKVRGTTPPTYEAAIFFTDVSADCRAAISSFVATQVPA